MGVPPSTRGAGPLAQSALDGPRAGWSERRSVPRLAQRRPLVVPPGLGALCGPHAYARPRLALLTGLSFASLGGLLACAKPPIPRADTLSSPDSAVVRETRVQLREQVRQVLLDNCRECHTKGLATALPGALQVYDLTVSDWSARMSDGQLHALEGRLREPFGPTLDDLEIRPLSVSAENLDDVHRFVELELWARRAGP
jgi:mono/diheme cytochrome c family protein